MPHGSALTHCDNGPNKKSNGHAHSFVLGANSTYALIHQSQYARGFKIFKVNKYFLTSEPALGLQN